MSTDPLKLWNDTQPTLLINSVKLIKNHQSARKKAKTVSQKHHECDSLSSQDRLSDVKHFLFRHSYIYP